MVLAALVCFGLLLVGWVAAPTEVRSVAPSAVPELAALPEAA
jgi:hypothetical protein